MSETVVIKAHDGHQLDLYVAHPATEPIAGLVVIQEIFGVNRHIRSIVDGYAANGFLAVAPALFDRFQRGVELAYDGPDAQKGAALMQKMNLDDSLIDIAAALEFVRAQTGKKAGVIGFCLGGLLAWLSAARLHPDAAVGYYAGRIGNYASETPKDSGAIAFRKARHAHPRRTSR